MCVYACVSAEVSLFPALSCQRGGGEDTQCACVVWVCVLVLNLVVTFWKRVSSEICMRLTPQVTYNVMANQFT